MFLYVLFNLQTEVYAPKGGVKDSGAVFHIVVKHIATDQLSSYATRVYKPVKVTLDPWCILFPVFFLYHYSHFDL